MSSTESLSELQQARAGQRLMALGEMVGGIAHDFRNLIAVIDSGLKLAERNSEHPEKVRDFIAAAREGISRGGALTNQLLTFAKQRALEVRAEDANELIEDSEVLLTYGAGPDVRIVFDLAENLPRCLIDPAQFNVSMLNLVVNARDAMPNGGEIRISTKELSVEAATSGSGRSGEYIRVRVKDTGQGMPPNVMRKIFDPFFTTKGEAGTGLGLPQVCALMRRVGGHIDVASEPGFGTTFDLLFPIVRRAGSSRLPAIVLDALIEHGNQSKVTHGTSAIEHCLD